VSEQCLTHRSSRVSFDATDCKFTTIYLEKIHKKAKEN